jgi:integral membrane sensor domain MASE1
MVNGFDQKTLLFTSALLAALYFGAGKLGLTLAFVNASATAVWPPAGIALAAFLVLGYRVWPGILLAAFLVNLTTTGGVASSIGIAMGNTLEGILGAYLVIRFAHGRHVFEHPPDVFKFAGIAMVGPSVAATIGFASLLFGGYASWNDLGGIWWTWWLGDSEGVLLVAPLLVLWSTTSLGPWRTIRGLEAALLSLALILTGLILFGGFLVASVKHYPLEFLAFPVLAWVAFRFGPRETVVVTGLLSAIAIWVTLRGFGPFVGDTQNESLLLAQAFIALAGVPSLVLAAAVGDRMRAEEAIRYLDDASVQLAGSLDYGATLQCTVRLFVPALADCCIITTNPDSEPADKAVVSYQHPSNRQPLEDVLSAYPYGLDASRAAQPKLYPEIRDALLVTAAHDADHLRRLRGLRLECAMSLPMVARRQTLGIITLYSTRPGRHYQMADLALVEDVARRTALALDNARLYAQQFEIIGHLHQLHGRLEAFERERLLEDERHRIALELHDRVEQTFFGIGLTARATLDQATI